VVYDLDALLDRVTPANRHSEVDLGRPVGKEIW
jgi:antitoxin component of MazEF toxin-antitoxin module